MKSSYSILDVSEQASDAEIKQAYLQKVKQFPPDHHHDQFLLIQQAYESIKDPTSRAKYALFSIVEADFDALLDQAFNCGEHALISAEHFDRLLHASINDNTLKTVAANTLTR